MATSAPYAGAPEVILELQQELARAATDGLVDAAASLLRQLKADGHQKLVHDCLVRVVYENRASAVATLLDAGADPAVGDALGQTPLHWAARERHQESAAELLRSCGTAVVNARSRSGATALHLAAEADCGPIAQLLMRHGADTVAVDSSGRTALHIAAERGGVSAMTAMLETATEQHMADSVSSALKVVARGDAPLACAATRGHTAIVEMLLKARADPDQQGRAQQTALHLASRGGHVDTVLALLRVGASPDLQARDGSTSVHAAALADRGAAEILDLLVVHYGGSIDTRNDAGQTALHVVADRAPVSLASSRRSATGETSVGSSGVEATEALLMLRADPEMHAADGRTPLDCAVARGRQEVIAVLSRNVGEVADAAEEAEQADDDDDKEESLKYESDAAFEEESLEEDDGDDEEEEAMDAASQEVAAAESAIEQAEEKKERATDGDHADEEEEERVRDSGSSKESVEKKKEEQPVLESGSSVESVAGETQTKLELVVLERLEEESEATLELDEAKRCVADALITAKGAGSLREQVEELARRLAKNEELLPQASGSKQDLDAAGSDESTARPSASAALAMALAVPQSPAVQEMSGKVEWQPSEEEPVKLWRYMPGNGLPVTVRALPEMDAPRTGAEVNPDDLVKVVEERRGVDSILYLKLADGAWIFESKLAVGKMCVRHGQEKQHRAELEIERRKAALDEEALCTVEASEPDKGHASSPNGTCLRSPTTSPNRPRACGPTKKSIEDGLLAMISRAESKERGASSNAASRSSSPAKSLAPVTCLNDEQHGASDYSVYGNDYLASDKVVLWQPAADSQNEIGGSSSSRPTSRGSSRVSRSQCSSRSLPRNLPIGRTQEEHAAAFLDLMRAKGKGSVAVTWRRHFDANGDGMLGFQEFCDVLAGIDYNDDVLKLWQAFDKSNGQSHKLGLDAFDPEAAHLIDILSAWMKEKGGPRAVFAKVDTDDSDTLSSDEFVRGLRELGFFDTPDMPEALSSEDQFLKNALPIIDPWNTGCILLFELMFLEPDRKLRKRLQKQLEREREKKAQDANRTPTSAAKMLHGLAKKGHLGGKYWTKAWQDEVLPDATEQMPQMRVAEAPPRLGGNNAFAGLPRRRSNGARPQSRLSNSSSTPELNGAPKQKLPIISGCPSLPRLAPPSKSLRNEPPLPPRMKPPNTKAVYGKKSTSASVGLPALGADVQHKANVVMLGKGRSVGGRASGAARQQVDDALHPCKQEDFFRRGADRHLFAKYCVPTA